MVYKISYWLISCDVVNCDKESQAMGSIKKQMVMNAYLPSGWTVKGKRTFCEEHSQSVTA